MTVRRRVVEALEDAYPHAVTTEDVAEMVGAEVVAVERVLWEEAVPIRRSGGWLLPYTPARIFAEEIAALRPVMRQVALDIGRPVR